MVFQTVTKDANLLHRNVLTAMKILKEVIPSTIYYKTIPYLAISYKKENLHLETLPKIIAN